MNKAELKRGFWNLADEKEKEKYINESANALYGYIRTGAKNIRLEEMASLESEFTDRYKERISKEKITAQVSGLINDCYKECVKSIDKITTDKNDHEEKETSEIIKKVLEEINTKTAEIFSDSIEKLVKDIVYLSHMNMLYELYEKQEKLRREEKEFENLSKNFTKMAKVAETLSKERRMELVQLRNKLDLSESEMNALLKECDKYFNVRKKQQGILVSLSVVGKKFMEYCLNASVGSSNEKVNGLIYKNCDKIMNALENSYKRRIKYDLQLDGLNPDKEAAIKFKYNRLVDDMLDYNMADGYYYRKGKRSENGRNEFRIPGNWDEGFYENVF